ncbi:MAG: rRNA maturation RNase YbeY [Gammaproteobacteria bacterium]
MINVTTQYVVEDQTNCPNEKILSLWANSACIKIEGDVELTIRIVDETESASLNETYRNKQSATNVLAFPFDVDKNVELILLGDLVICAQIVINEARQQLKTEVEHWAHMVVHGVLHLQGYDHIDTEQAEEMESLEIQILNTLGYQNPYQVSEL